MDFFDKTGKVAIGSRLRIFTDTITSDAAKIYAMYGVSIKPKWFPILFVLGNGETKTITGIAQEIGHSHPSVSNIVKEMAGKGLIKEVIDKNDRRRNAIALSNKGKDVATMVIEVCIDVATAIEEISNEAHNDLWKAIGEWEELLTKKSLLQRVKEAKRVRDSHDVQIVSYKPYHKELFKSLNEYWITQYWKIEPHDLDYLDHPQEYIIDKGGFIFVATYKETPVGVCALCKMDDNIYDYELAKLAVSPNAQGKGIGQFLCEAVIQKAKILGAKKVFLESNTILKPAINLYHKLGFKELKEYHPAYARGDIQMELSLK